MLSFKIDLGIVILQIIYDVCIITDKSLYTMLLYILKAAKEAETGSA